MIVTNRAATTEVEMTERGRDGGGRFDRYDDRRGNDDRDRYRDR